MTAAKDDDLLLADGPNKGGRPRILEPNEATLKLLRGMGRLHCTTKECAAFFSVAEPTYLRFVRDFPEAAEAYREGTAEGKMSLRRSQFRLAEKNAAMAIFLGKQHLGQVDARRHEHGGLNGRPIETVDLTKLSAEELEAYETLALKLGAEHDLSPGDAGGDPGGEAEAPGGEEPI